MKLERRHLRVNLFGRRCLMVQNTKGGGGVGGSDGPEPEDNKGREVMSVGDDYSVMG